MILIFDKRYDVIVIGNVAIDNFIKINEKYRKLFPGDKVLINETFTEVGGGAANAAISLSNFGLSVQVISKLGYDYNAAVIEHKLRDENVNLHIIRSKKYETSFSIILMSKKEIDRIVFSYKSSSEHLMESDLNFRDLSTKWIYLGSLLGRSFKTAEKIAEYAKHNNIKILFNPSTYLASKGKKILKEILKCTNTLILNKEEARLIVEKKLGMKELLLELINLGPETVIITDGKNTINAMNGKSIYTLEPYKVNIVSTLGAGDAFASGFLGSYIISGSLEKSLKIGTANAASVLQYMGATKGILTYKKAVGYISKHKPRLTEYVKLR